MCLCVSMILKARNTRGKEMPIKREAYGKKTELSIKNLGGQETKESKHPPKA